MKNLAVVQQEIGDAFWVFAGRGMKEHYVDMQKSATGMVRSATLSFGSNIPLEKIEVHESELFVLADSFLNGAKHMMDAIEKGSAAQRDINKIAMSEIIGAESAEKWISFEQEQISIMRENVRILTAHDILSHLRQKSRRLTLLQ